jgi:hypothetical protein
MKQSQPPGQWQSSVPWRSLFEMKYETFKECLNLKITDYKVKENAQDT